MLAPSRTLIIHHDDLGASHGANEAFVQRCDLGIVTCGSAMVPGPWFPGIATIARERPDLDIGVHLTLNAEFPSYRWRPLSGARSLIDSQGYFFPTIDQARSATRDEVTAELRSQIDVAYSAGIDVTHLDSHMGTVWQPEFVDLYLDLGNEYRLPIVLPSDLTQLSASHFDVDAIIASSWANGNPEFRTYLTTQFCNLAPTLDTYKALFDRAEPGLNWCGFHFAKPGDIDAISEDAPTRIAEYQLFKADSLRKMLQAADYRLEGMRAKRDWLRSR